MPSMDRLDRRRVLAGVGALGVASLAGCLDAFDDGDDPGTGDGEASERTVGLGVHIPPEDIEEIQTDISEAIENGELSQQEAQAEFAQRQQDFYNETTTDARDWLADDSPVPVTVEDTLPSQSLVVATAEPTDLLELLETDQIAAIIPEEDVQESETDQ